MIEKNQPARDSTVIRYFSELYHQQKSQLCEENLTKAVIHSDLN